MGDTIPSFDVSRAVPLATMSLVALNSRRKCGGQEAERFAGTVDLN